MNDKISGTDMKDIGIYSDGALSQNIEIQYSDNLIQKFVNYILIIFWLPQK